MQRKPSAEGYSGYVSGMRQHPAPTLFLLMVLLRLRCGSRDMRHSVISSVPPRNTAALMPAGGRQPEENRRLLFGRVRSPVMRWCGAGSSIQTLFRCCTRHVLYRSQAQSAAAQPTCHLDARVLQVD